MLLTIQFTLKLFDHHQTRKSLTSSLSPFPISEILFMWQEQEKTKPVANYLLIMHSKLASAVCLVFQDSRPHLFGVCGTGKILCSSEGLEARWERYIGYG